MNIDLDKKQIHYLLRVLVSNYAETIEDFDGDITDRGPSGLIIGKLAKVDRDVYAWYADAKRSNYLKEKLNKFLFMGAGNGSLVLLNDLHRRLNFAASQASGRQQNGGMGTEFDDAYEVKAKQDIVDVVKDMMIAFNISVDDLK